MQVSVRLGAILIPEYLDYIFRNIFLFRNIPNERTLRLVISRHLLNPYSFISLGRVREHSLSDEVSRSRALATYRSIMEPTGQGRIIGK